MSVFMQNVTSAELLASRAHLAIDHLFEGGNVRSVFYESRYAIMLLLHSFKSPLDEERQREGYTVSVLKDLVMKSLDPCLNCK
jgi:hypothetical protein